jgi:hypothetical protein
MQTAFHCLISNRTAAESPGFGSSFMGSAAADIACYITFLLSRAFFFFFWKT